ncbi:long-chain fatty acid--CoA ligase [Mariprofundus erugo]|uniref:AMP-dependent synthetase/ligase n=1 Tax=Mariprofundus erugo TaxID=2528639 RepID=UPI0010FE788D|nr:long-chain fatty acid--CoA ligase [Mariprofundus erugo]TLS77372.1 long-chain fatty acid--CoA ligase [Mariprofundus erugo]
MKKSTEIERVPAGAAGIDQISSLPEALFQTAKQLPEEPAQWHRKDGQYLSITYAQLASQVRYLACGLIRSGIKPGDRIAILMENRPEWAVIDYAILAVGAITVPLYCSYRPQDISYVLNDSGAIAAFVSGGKLIQDLLTAVEHSPAIRHIYSIEKHHHPMVSPMVSLEGGELDDASLSRRMSAVDRNTLATLVYTSGTTGNPKGVMLSHGNIITNLESVPAVIDIHSGRSGDRLLSFLPLAHALERTGSHFLAYSFGLSVAFAERPETVAKNMQESRPTLMIAVPRMLEVIRSRILAHAKNQPLLHRTLFYSYVHLAAKRNNSMLAKLFLPLLDKLVGEKIRQRFGGRLRALISGGAPLGVELTEFFESIGLPVLEGYGLSESAPLISVNPMQDRRAGSVGLAAKGVEIKIAADGEILARGANIMAGYWKNRKASKEVLQDGWLHTGDIGTLDSDGYLRITDRKKDIIVTSGGENIAPQRIEQLLLEDDMIDQVVVYGDQRPYLVALIVANETACREWSDHQGLPETDWRHLCDSPVLKKQLQVRVNQHLKPLNPFEQIRRIHLISEPFAVETGLLTPTMKIRRRKVSEYYESAIEALYHKESSE